MHQVKLTCIHDDMIDDVMIQVKDHVIEYAMRCGDVVLCSCDTRSLDWQESLHCCTKESGPADSC
jgi:hypothetical protein